MNRPATRFHPLSFLLLGLLMLGLPSLVAQQNWPAAIKGLQQQLRSKPRDKNLRTQLAVAYNNYAMDLGQQKKWKEATSQMEEALQLDRQNARFKENISMVYLNYAYQLYQEPTRERSYQSYRHQEAKTLLEKALRQNTKLASAHLLLGDIEYDNQRLPMAKLNWEKAKRLDPNLTGLARIIHKF